MGGLVGWGSLEGLAFYIVTLWAPTTVDSQAGRSLSVPTLLPLETPVRCGNVGELEVISFTTGSDVTPTTDVFSVPPPPSLTRSDPSAQGHKLVKGRACALQDGGMVLLPPPLVGSVIF